MSELSIKHFIFTYHIVNIKAYILISVNNSFILFTYHIVNIKVPPPIQLKS